MFCRYILLLSPIAPSTSNRRFEEEQCIISFFNVLKMSPFFLSPKKFPVNWNMITLSSITSSSENQKGLEPSIARGGGASPPPPPSTFFAIIFLTQKALAPKFSWLFFFHISRTFYSIIPICDKSGARFQRLRNLCMHMLCRDLKINVSQTIVILKYKTNAILIFFFSVLECHICWKFSKLARMAEINLF